MANYNKVLLMGNLTRDPELRYIPSGTAVVNLRLAVNRRYKDRSGEQKEETCFITVVVWDKQAELCNQYLQKGRPVFVEGKLQSRSFEDSSGNKRYVIDVRADRVQFLGSRPAAQTQTTTEADKKVENDIKSGENQSWIEGDFDETN